MPNSEKQQINKHSLSTIAALATAPGKAGVAIIRISGDLAESIGKQLTGTILRKQIFSYCHFYNEQQQIIDTGLILLFKAPHSFTGEDIVECHCHGSPIIVEQLLSRIYQLGAEAAVAGEFCQRAFSNDKLDLLQAEAIMDLIHADSKQAAQAAQRTLQGVFSDYLQSITQQFVQLRASIELSLDFPDEQEDFIDLVATAQQIRGIQASIHELIAKAHSGKRLTEATKVVIIGAPNVGKSTLLNQLVEADRAIVTDIAGTTRDLIEADVNMAGLPLQLVDTAGIHSSDNLIEQEGIRRSQVAAEAAELILWVVDARCKDADLPIDISDQQKLLIIANKCDLLNRQPGLCQDTGKLFISALQNSGIDALKQAIVQMLNFQSSVSNFSARAYHISRLKQAALSLQEALDNLHQEPELSAESIKLAHQASQSLTGKFTSDELLGEIFANFCIGK